MEIAWLLLILVPLAFLPDMADSDPEEDHDEPVTPDVLGGIGGSLIDPSGGFGGVGTGVTDILSPVLDDDVPDDGTQTPDPGSVLSPVIEDDSPTPSDGGEGEILLPIVENDSDLAVSRQASEQDIGQGFASIDDFQVGQDVLHVALDAVEDGVPGNADVRPSDNGRDGLVFVDGHLVAVLRDAPDVMARDIFVEIENQAGRSHNSGFVA